VQEGKLDMVKRNKEWKAQVFIQIPDALKIEYKADEKALDEKYKGKLRPVESKQPNPSSKVQPK
jgi:hypothetical protein